MDRRFRKQNRALFLIGLSLLFAALAISELPQPSVSMGGFGGVGGLFVYPCVQVRESRPVPRFFSFRLLNENERREVFAMMKLGYARVSTNEQDTAAQVSELKSVGCEKIFRVKASGGRWDGPELHRLLDRLRTGDVLLVLS